mgnify:CR=1 FL=1
MFHHVIGTIHPYNKSGRGSVSHLGYLSSLCAALHPDLPIRRASNPWPSTVSVLRRNLDSVTFSCWQQIVMYIKSLSLLLLYARCYLIATGALSRYRPYVSSIPKMYNSFILWEHGTWCWTRTNIVLLVREVHNLSAQPGLVPLVRIELTTLPCQSNVIPFHHRGVNLFFSSSRNRCR